MKNNSIHKNHRARMREKYKKHGADIFETHQLVEMQLFSSIRQGDTNPAAHSLLNTHPYAAFGVETPSELCDADGIGEASAVMLCISRDANIRLLCEMIAREPLESESSRKLFLWLWFRNKGEKCVAALLLGNNSKYEDCVLLAEGRLSRPENYSDALISKMKSCGAKAAVLCHNHWNNSKIPSVEDYYLTAFLNKALKKEGLSLDAHYIVTDTDIVECPKE